MANGGSQCELPPVPVCDAPPAPPSILLQVLCEDTVLLANYRYVRLLDHIDPTRYYLGSPIQCAEAEVLTWNKTTSNWEAGGTIICVCDFVGNRMHKHDRAIVKQENHCLTTETCGAQDCGDEEAQGESAIWWIHEVHEFGCWVILKARLDDSYSWEELEPLPNGLAQSVTEPRTGEFNAYEINGKAEDWHLESGTNLIDDVGGSQRVYGRIVWLRRDNDGDYLFAIDETETRYVRLDEDIDNTRWYLGSPVQSGEATVLEWDTITSNWVQGAVLEKIIVNDFVGNRMHKGDRAIVSRNRQTYSALSDPESDAAKGLWWIVEVHEFGLWAKILAKFGEFFFWEEAEHSGGCTWLTPAHPRIGVSAVEVNCQPNVPIGTIVWLRRGRKGQYVFEFGGGDKSTDWWWSKLTDRSGEAYSHKQVERVSKSCAWVLAVDGIAGTFNAFDINCSKHNSQGPTEDLVVQMYGPFLDLSSGEPFFLFDYAGTNEFDNERFAFIP